jgi:hypothetical protein
MSPTVPFGPRSGLFVGILFGESTRIMNLVLRSRSSGSIACRWVNRRRGATLSNNNESKQAGISIHIFSVSAAMVGVCLTVIGIIRVVISSQNVSTLIDDFLALDSLMFLAACLFAYAAMRSVEEQRKQRMERIADGFFIFALILMVMACGLITYAIV